MKTALSHNFCNSSNLHKVAGFIHRYTVNVITILLFLITNTLVSQTVKENFWVPNGPVNAIAPSSDSSIIYIGGSFSQVGPAVGGGVIIDTATGIYDADFPKINGQVYAVIPDGSGGLYVGGEFTYVGDVARNCLVHIKPDKTVDADWDPNVNYGMYGIVYTLAISGTTIYVGGHFFYVSDSIRQNIAAIDISTGKATDWNPCAMGIAVYALAISGDIVFAGGDFYFVGRQPNLVAIDKSTGTVTDWYPLNVSIVGSIKALAISDTILYAGGDFWTDHDSTRYLIAAFSVLTGEVAAWNPYANGFDYRNHSVNELTILGNIIYGGGLFATIGDSVRNGLAALDATTGKATAWNPNPGGSPYSTGVSAIAFSGNTVYVGGGFFSIGDSSRNNIAALDLATGKATTWNPNAGNTVSVLALYGNTVYAGGTITCINGQARKGLAAIDASTGLPTSWNPCVDNPTDYFGFYEVLGFAVSGTTVYAGGHFTNVGDSIRNNITAIDGITGQATSWNPNANGDVQAIAVSGGIVYAGGYFTSIGDSTRNYIAALDTTTGKATSWNPNASVDGKYSISTLAISGPDVYVGGYFAYIGGESRGSIAALDILTGKATSWNPAFIGSFYATLPLINTIAISGSTIYAGGYFTEVNGQARKHIAAVDAFPGDVTSWNPIANFSVRALAISGTTVYTGGGYFHWRAKQKLYSSTRCIFRQCDKLEPKCEPACACSFSFWKNRVCRRRL